VPLRAFPMQLLAPEMHARRGGTPARALKCGDAVVRVLPTCPPPYRRGACLPALHCPPTVRATLHKGVVARFPRRTGPPRGRAAAVSFPLRPTACNSSASSTFLDTYRSSPVCLPSRRAAHRAGTRRAAPAAGHRRRAPSPAAFPPGPSPQTNPRTPLDPPRPAPARPRPPASPEFQSLRRPAAIGATLQTPKSFQGLICKKVTPIVQQFC
jgi:hypothetical protein